MQKRTSLRTFILCMITFILCILATGAPLERLAGTTQLATLPTSLLLTMVGTKLPTNLHLTANVHNSRMNSDSLEFLSLTALSYLLYALSAYVAQKRVHAQVFPTFATRSVQSRSMNTLLCLIWIGAILLGIVYVLMPSILSRDSTVYAAYGRIIMVYHANPYYIPLSAFPHDPLFQADDWRNALAAYGPIWLAVCAASTLVAKGSVLYYIFFYRILGLLSHLINIALVTTVLRKTSRSPRVIVLGTLLYAWNPLVLLESSMGGHNDIEMLTCMLLGVLLCVRAEQDAFVHARYYLPPIVAFTGATLIKFTAAPIIGFYLILLARHVLTNAALYRESGYMHNQSLKFIALRKVFNAILVCICLTVILYTPLWLGHTLHEIVDSLGSPPSSRLALESTLRALQEVEKVSPHVNVLLAVFSSHSTWMIINLVVVGSVFGIGVLCLWRTPTMPIMIYATLATLEALLLVTPWFFPWYVTWIVSFAAIAFPTYHNHGKLKRALVLSTLTFSGSAFLIYLFRGYPPIGGWVGYACLSTIGPPLLVFLFVLLFSPKKPSRSPEESFESVKEVNQPVL